MIFAMPSIIAGAACTSTALRRQSATTVIFFVFLPPRLPESLSEKEWITIAVVLVAVQILQLPRDVLRLGILQRERAQNPLLGLFGLSISTTVETPLKLASLESTSSEFERSFAATSSVSFAPLFDILIERPHFFHQVLRADIFQWNDPHRNIQRLVVERFDQLAGQRQVFIVIGHNHLVRAIVVSMVPFSESAVLTFSLISAAWTWCSE